MRCRRLDTAEETEGAGRAAVGAEGVELNARSF